MKKLLGILVLGFPICSKAYAESLLSSVEDNAFLITVLIIIGFIIMAFIKSKKGIKRESIKDRVLRFYKEKKALRDRDSIFLTEEDIKQKKFEKKFNIIVVLTLIFLIASYIGYRSYHTKILPFQSITLECTMKGRQLFPSSGGAELAPIVKFPRVFKIKFGFWDGEFLEGGEVLIKNHFLEKKIFGYQHVRDSLKIEPTYIPPSLPEGDAPGRSMWFIFPLMLDGRSDLWIDYFMPDDDYDAHYECNEVK